MKNCGVVANGRMRMGKGTMLADKIPKCLVSALTSHPIDLSPEENADYCLGYTNILY
jgi:hypothetical protein